jgi:hypothetical protein
MDYILAFGTLVVLLADIADHLWPAFTMEAGETLTTLYADAA